jgi:uncharacterized integral membrane protein (TIGR00697 family)
MKKENNSPKLLLFFAMLYLTIMFTGTSVLHKEILIFSHPVTATAVVTPLWFITSDIIAEIYGIQIAKKVFYLAVMCQWIFSIANAMLIHMKSPESWVYQNYFDYVYHGLIRLNVSMLIAILIAGNLNIHLINKWKFLLKGKHFWLRSMGASGLSEIFYSIFASIFIFWGTLNKTELFSYIIMSLTLKIIYTVILAYPANIVTFVVAKIEGNNIKNINPLKKESN